MSDFEIEKTLVASTSHVLPDDFDILDRANDIEHTFTVNEYEYGWRLYLHDGIINNLGSLKISEGINELVLFAVFGDCAYLKLDSDGPIYEGFSAYEW